MLINTKINCHASSAIQWHITCFWPNQDDLGWPVQWHGAKNGNHILFSVYKTWPLQWPLFHCSLKFHKQRPSRVKQQPNNIEFQGTNSVKSSVEIFEVFKSFWNLNLPMLEMWVNGLFSIEIEDIDICDLFQCSNHTTLNKITRNNCTTSSSQKVAYCRKDSTWRCQMLFKIFEWKS